MSDTIRRCEDLALDPPEDPGLYCVNCGNIDREDADQDEDGPGWTCRKCRSTEVIEADMKRYTPDYDDQSEEE